MSSLPNSLTMWPMTDSICFSSVTSSASAVLSGALAAERRAVSMSTSLYITHAPLAANRSAMAWPIPRAAPVTRATLLVRSTFIALRQDRMDDVAEDVRQTVIAAAVAIGQPGVVDAHQMQDGRVQIVDMHAIFDSV